MPSIAFSKANAARIEAEINELGPTAVPSTSYKEHDVGSNGDYALQSSIYMPHSRLAAQIEQSKHVRENKGGKNLKGGKRQTVVVSGGGKTWMDDSLLEWDPSWFRLWVGNLSNDVTEEKLNHYYMQWPSYKKSKVITFYPSGHAHYAFIAFAKADDALAAWRQSNDKAVVGNKPLKICRAKGEIQKKAVGAYKQKVIEENLQAGAHVGKSGKGRLTGVQRGNIR